MLSAAMSDTVNKNGAGSFEPPPHERKADGEMRRVGVELEMAGLRPEAVARAVVDTIGGQIETRNAFVTDITGADAGDFRVELDADVLKSRTYQTYLSEMGIEIGDGQTREHLETILSRIAGLVVPIELVCPPVPWCELEVIDRIRARLQQLGARGTEASAFYAFGLQLNIEAARLDADYLLAILRAFLLRYDHLIEHEQVDLSRRITPFIQSHPEEYVVHVLQPDYAPDIDELIEDFLRLTPTRNRPLDMLPLFAHIDRDRVMAAPVETELIKPRPAFHYRLPSCRIDDPQWSLADAWNRWVGIEQLADDRERINRECRHRLSQSGPLRQWLSAAWRRLRW